MPQLAVVYTNILNSAIPSKYRIDGLFIRGAERLPLQILTKMKEAKQIIRLIENEENTTIKNKKEIFK